MMSAPPPPKMFSKAEYFLHALCQFLPMSMFFLSADTSDDTPCFFYVRQAVFQKIRQKEQHQQEKESLFGACLLRSHALPNNQPQKQRRGPPADRAAVACTKKCHEETEQDRRGLFELLPRDRESPVSLVSAGGALQSCQPWHCQP